MISKNNELIGTILKHVIMGKYFTTKFRFKNVEPITTKIHLTVIQESSSGKSESLKPLQYVSNKLKLSCSDYTQTTDAGLVGTMIKKPKKIIDKEIKDGIYTTPFEPLYGRLYDTDILSFSEAQDLFGIK